MTALIVTNIDAVIKSITWHAMITAATDIFLRDNHPTNSKHDKYMTGG